MLYNATSPEASASSSITAGTFWPSLDMGFARQAMRLDGTVTDERLRLALIHAIASVDAELVGWQAAQQQAGYTRLQAIPALQIDGASVLVNHWQRAVLCLAAASLNERYRAYDTTGTGKDRAQDLEDTVDTLRRDAHWAISDIRQTQRTTVELI